MSEEKKYLDHDGRPMEVGDKVVWEDGVENWTWTVVDLLGDGRIMIKAGDWYLANDPKDLVHKNEPWHPEKKCECGKGCPSHYGNQTAGLNVDHDGDQLPSLRDLANMSRRAKERCDLERAKLIAGVGLCTEPKVSCCSDNKELKEIRIQLDDGAYIPERAHAWDAGLDLRTPEDLVLLDHDSETVDIGVHVEIPEGYVGMIKSKSGLNVNHGITAEGVIDAGYTGSISVKLYNNEGMVQRFAKGDKIAQLVILPVATPKPVVVAGIKGGERGDGGFGSTGR